jgi:hypothetical protein
MRREPKLKNAEDYESVVAKEMEYYGPMARELGIAEDVLVQAARLGVRDGLFRHRESPDCKNREQECVTWNLRHMVDLTLIRAALLAGTDEEMSKAEEVLMRLIED